MRPFSLSKQYHAQQMRASSQPSSRSGQPRPSITAPQLPPYPDEVLKALPPIGGKQVGSTLVENIRRIQRTLARHTS